MAAPAQLTNKQKQRYGNLFAFLRKRKSSSDDVLAQECHDLVFENTNCLTCANCCKTYPPLLKEKDIMRIANHLKITAAQFVAQYAVIDEDGDWVMHTVPCPFLLQDNACSIYAVRPGACKAYPHTNQKKLYQIADITLKNAEICPAVAPILDAMMAKLPIQ